MLLLLLFWFLSFVRGPLAQNELWVVQIADGVHQISIPFLSFNRLLLAADGPDLDRNSLSGVANVDVQGLLLGGIGVD